jgi:ligand-binding SRPBCC domain-containing protein
MYQLEREQEIETTIQKVWDFIKTPRNLDSITPPELEFKIVSDVLDSMFNGLVIE